MSHKQTIILITLLLLILIGLAYMWPFKKRSASPKIVETKTFSCPGMEDFTFEYPVFEGWKYSRVVNTPVGCDVMFFMEISETKRPEIALININNKIGVGFENPPGSEINKNKITYFKIDDSSVRFNQDKFTTFISLTGVSEDSGFPRDLFFQTVINSFRVVK